MKSCWLKNWKTGSLPFGLNSVLFAGAVLLLASPANAGLPYNSARQGRAETPLSGASPDGKAVKDCESGTCAKPLGALPSQSADDHKYGTTITWVDSPREAGKLAEAQHKLAFIIQLSGDFTRDEFT